MSHVLRAAVAATSLFSCPACVTTGVPARTVAEPAEAGTAVPADAPAGGAVRWWRSASGPVPDAPAALLAREQAQAAPATGRTSMTIEPGDSRLRLVLNLMDPIRGPVTTGSSAGGTSTISTSGTSAANELAPEELSHAAAIWSVPAALGAPEVLGLTRVALNRPPESGAAEFFTRLLAEPRNTPEPGTLALAGLGLCGAAVIGRLRRARATRLIPTSV